MKDYPEQVIKDAVLEATKILEYPDIKLVRDIATQFHVKLRNKLLAESQLRKIAAEKERLQVPISADAQRAADARQREWMSKIRQALGGLVLSDSEASFA